MFQELRKKLVNKVKSRFTNLTSRRFDLSMMVVFLLINAILVALSMQRGIVQYDIAFLRSNYLALISVVLLNIGVLYVTFRDYAKKYPSIGFLAIYLFALALISFSVVSVITVLENFTNRAHFSQTTYLFIFFFLIMVGVFVSKYDFPITANWKEWYKVSVDHFYRNLGIFLSLALVVSIIGFISGAFVYTAAYLILGSTIYLAKAILANVRK